MELVSGKEPRARRRVRFSREAAVEDALIEGEAKGRAEGLDEGEAKGRAEGLDEGEAKGRAEGHAEGRAEGRADIAMRMLEEGEPEAKISRITGLSQKELTLLKRGLKAKKE